MWAPSAEYKMAMVNQASKSLFMGQSSSRALRSASALVSACVATSSGMDTFHKYNKDVPCVFKLPALGNDALVLKVDVIVEREDRFQLDTGGVPCDMVLKLPCGVKVPALSQFLQEASPFFCGALEDVKDSGPILVDGSLGAWTYILSCLLPLHDQPDLTLHAGYALLPVVHKYDFTKLLTRLVSFVTEKIETLSPEPSSPQTIIAWLALAERLQLFELCELCFGQLRHMTKKQRETAITVRNEK
ncbi:hypothetical protein FOA52_005439 [Chlamydomonas sp. UWO 241]|nr:hypothetical protein FOA52_005439 [Chlamydomonas sp. UWO 241]